MSLSMLVHRNEHARCFRQDRRKEELSAFYLHQFQELRRLLTYDHF